MARSELEHAPVDVLGLLEHSLLAVELRRLEVVDDLLGRSVRAASALVAFRARGRGIRVFVGATLRRRLLF